MTNKNKTQVNTTKTYEVERLVDAYRVYVSNVEAISIDKAIEKAHTRITLSTRPNNREGGADVHTILVDGVEYKAFVTYEIAAWVRHAMIDAIGLILK